MRLTTTSLSALTLALALAAAACTEGQSSDGTGSDGTSSETTLAPTDTTDNAGIDVQDVVRRIGDGQNRIAGEWPGFEPNEHPAVLALKSSDGELQGAIAVNFPAPDVLGDAEELDVSGTPLTSAHHITNPAESEKLQQLTGFDFHFEIGGVDSFAMEAGGPDDFFDPGTDDYVGTYLHEMFHRWQDEGFSADIGSQDVEGYAYTSENLALAALEERALVQALATDDDDDRVLAARQVSAIRLARMAADPRVADLDNSQERYEGTARYLEHRLGGDDTDFGHYNETDYTAELVTDPTKAPGVKDHYGFGRFYATGAAMLGLLDALGADGVDDEIEGGLSPVEVLIRFLGVTEADVDQLVADAKTEHDPLEQLDALGADAAEQAKNESPVFGDEDGGQSPDVDAQQGEAITISDAELNCFSERGIDLGNGDQPSDEDVEACIAAG